MNNLLTNLLHRDWKNNTSASMWITLAIYHAIFFFILLTNFHSSGSLMGWDGLYPEQNIPLNITRGLASGWQEYYGTGVVGGHGFAATLPHTLVIALLSYILPLELLRMIFVLLCYYLGGLGMIWASAKALTHIFTEHTLDHTHWYISLVAALYHLFNLGSIQTFYLPLEAFTVQFASLPWLIHAVMRVFEKRSGKRILWLLILSVLSSTQGFIPSLFLSYVASLACISAGFLWIHKGTWSTWKTVFSVWTATIVGNLYWLGSVIYFSLTQSKDYISAYNNIISTPEFITKSIQYGSLSKVALLQGLYWSSNELGGPIMSPWINHFSSPLIPIIGYGFFILAVIGVIISMTTKRHTIAFGLSIAAIYTFGNLAIDTPPFTNIIQALQSHSPALAQAFRTTFTKFSINMAFFYSMSISIGLVYILAVISKYKKIPTTIATTIAIFFLIIYAMPVFRGNLIYSKLFVTTPPVYKQFTTYLNTLPNGRIADFPQDCNEGWYNYQWGHFGSGFLWYGVKHPIMARAFDVWSANNENYYWELSRALRQQRYEEVEQIFSKYDVSYILYDQNITHCRNQRALQSSLDYLSYLEQSPLYIKKKTYTGPHILPITIFERTQKKPENFISILPNPPNIHPIPYYADYDSAYALYGTYYTDSAHTATVPTLLTEPFSKRGEPIEMVSFDPMLEAVATVSASELTGVTCGPTTEQSDAQWSYTHSDESIVRLFNTNASSCINALFGGINTSNPYTLEISTRNITGSPLSISITNKERQVGLDILLPISKTMHTYRYHIPSSFPSELEYLLTIKNTSGNRYTSINDLGDIRLYKNNAVTPIRVATYDNSSPMMATITHPLPWVYEIKTTDTSIEKPMLTLAQSFDRGWCAYDVTSYNSLQKVFPFVFGKPLPNHVKVNNWENGWPIPNQEAIYRIVFLPQLLEYFGLVCLPIMVIMLLRRSK